MLDARTLVGACTFAALLATGACSDAAEPWLPGEYVRWNLEQTERVPCAGTELHLNRYMDRVFERVGVPAPAGFTVPVHVMDMPPCQEVNACYHMHTRSIYTKSLDYLGKRASETLLHEVTHAVSGQVWGDSIPFLVEGFAVAFARSGPWMAPAMGQPVGAMLDADAKDLDYLAAGHFSHFLIETRGIDLYQQLYRAAQVQDQAKVRAAFAEVYGETFEALESEFVSELACTFQLDVCGDAEVELVGAGWAVMLGGSCDDPDFYGSASADDVMIATQRTIEITKAGRYRLRGNGAKVELTRCGRCAEQTLYRYPYLGEVEVDLDAGRYAIEMMPREESVVSLEIVPVDPLP